MFLCETAAVGDRNEETCWMQETLYLYQHFYDHPVTLPSQLATELTGGHTALDSVDQQVAAVAVCADNGLCTK